MDYSPQLEVIRRGSPNPRPNPADIHIVTFQQDTYVPNEPTTSNESRRPFVYADPLRQSPKDSLPFPTRAAQRLASMRSSRYDDLAISIEETEFRLRELASIMGLMTTDDDMPSAA